MTLHVLIIEDEPLVAMMIEDVILTAGADSVEIAVCEADAVNLAGDHRPDFIISDVSLVEGNGPAAVRTIIELHGDIPVLFITATPDACSPCATLGRIMLKPVATSALAAEFKRLTCS